MTPDNGKRWAVSGTQLYSALFMAYMLASSTQNLVSILLSGMSHTVAQSILVLKDAYLGLIILIGACLWTWSAMKPGAAIRIRARVLILLILLAYLVVATRISPGGNLFSLRQLLTLSKGGIMGVLVGAGLYQVFERRTTSARVSIALASAVVLPGVFYLVSSGSVISLVNHFMGLLSGFMQLAEYPLGRGVGMAGNFAVISATNAGESASSLGLEGTGESYLGTLVGQTGLIGLGLYLWLFGYTLGIRLPREPVLQALKYAILATLIGGVASESAISYVGTGFLFGLLPLLAAESSKQRAEAT